MEVTTRSALYSSDNQISQKTLFDEVKSIIVADNYRFKELYIRFINIIDMLIVGGFNHNDDKKVWLYFLTIYSFSLMIQKQRFDVTSVSLCNLIDTINVMKKTLTDYFSHTHPFQKIARFIFKEPFVKLLANPIIDILSHTIDERVVYNKIRRLIVKLTHPLYDVLAFVPYMLTLWNGEENVIFDEEGTKFYNVPIPSVCGDYYYIHIFQQKVYIIIVRVAKYHEKRKASSKAKNTNARTSALGPVNSMVFYDMHRLDKNEIKTLPIPITYDINIEPHYMKLIYEYNQQQQTTTHLLRTRNLADTPLTSSRSLEKNGSNVTSCNNNSQTTLQAHILLNQPIPDLFLNFETIATTLNNDDTESEFIKEKLIRSRYLQQDVIGKLKSKVSDALSKFESFIEKNC